MSEVILTKEQRDFVIAGRHGPLRAILMEQGKIPLPDMDRINMVEEKLSKDEGSFPNNVTDLPSSAPKGDSAHSTHLNAKPFMESSDGAGIIVFPNLSDVSSPHEDEVDRQVNETRHVIEPDRGFRFKITRGKVVAEFNCGSTKKPGYVVSGQNQTDIVKKLRMDGELSAAVKALSDHVRQNVQESGLSDRMVISQHDNNLLDLSLSYRKARCGLLTLGVVIGDAEGRIGLNDLKALKGAVMNVQEYGDLRTAVQNIVERTVENHFDGPQ